MTASDNPRPWENLAEEPNENWRERKGESRENEEAGRESRGDKRDNERKGRGGFKGDRKGGYKSGGKYGRDDRGGKRGGYSGRPRRDNDRDDRGGRAGRDDWRRDDRGGKRNFERGGERRDSGRSGFRSSGSQRSRYDDRGYNRSHTGSDKRGHGTTGRSRYLEIPASITWDMLDKEAWSRLSPLPKETAENVARHLVMSAELFDTQPELAYEYARAALKMAWRIDVVREAVALTAYACGKYSEALREVKTARRMSGVEVLKSVEADSERGLGRPEKALEIIKAVKPGDLDRTEHFELALVESSARADLGEYETGLAVIEAALAQVDPDSCLLYTSPSPRDS